MNDWFFSFLKFILNGGSLFSLFDNIEEIILTSRHGNKWMKQLIKDKHNQQKAFGLRINVFIFKPEPSQRSADRRSSWQLVLLRSSVQSRGGSRTFILLTTHSQLSQQKLPCTNKLPTYYYKPSEFVAKY